MSFQPPGLLASARAHALWADVPEGSRAPGGGALLGGEGMDHMVRRWVSHPLKPQGDTGDGAGRFAYSSGPHQKVRL